MTHRGDDGGPKAKSYGAYLGHNWCPAVLVSVVGVAGQSRGDRSGEDKLLAITLPAGHLIPPSLGSIVLKFYHSGKHKNAPNPWKIVVNHPLQKGRQGTNREAGGGSLAVDALPKAILAQWYTFVVVVFAEVDVHRVTKWCSWKRIIQPGVKLSRDKKRRNERMNLLFLSRASICFRWHYRESGE